MVSLFFSSLYLATDKHHKDLISFAVLKVEAYKAIACKEIVWKMPKGHFEERP